MEKEVRLSAISTAFPTFQLRFTFSMSLYLHYMAFDLIFADTLKKMMKELDICYLKPTKISHKILQHS
jgi:hypothetical protein